MTPLSDVRLLELCRAETPRHLRIAMAMAGKLAAAQGAQLLSLSPIGDDFLATARPRLADGRSALGTFLSAGKRIVVPQTAKDIVRTAEVLIDKGLAGVVLAEGDPLKGMFKSADVPVIELATWPIAIERQRRNLMTNEFGIMATGGILDMLGDPSRAPLRLPGHQIAYAAGLSAFTALMAAIAQRDQDGRPLSARISLLETAIWINWKAILGAVGQGRFPMRLGSRAEFQVLPCADGWIAFVYTATQFERVLALLADLAPLDVRFSDRAFRSNNSDAFMAAIAPWFAARTREAIYAEARKHGVALGPVYSPGELLEDEQYRARDFFKTEASPLFPRLPVTWNGKRIDPPQMSTMTLAELEACPA